MAKYKKLKISQKSLAIKRDHIYTVKIVVENLIKTLESKAAGNIKFPTNSPDFEWVNAIMTLYAKAVKTYRAIYTLCYEGYAPEAIPLLRVLFEAELCLQYICATGKETAVRFASFIDYNRYEFYLKDPDKTVIKKIPKGKRIKFINDLKDKHDAHLNKYPDQNKRKSSWSGLTIREMCDKLDKLLGTDYRKHYLVNYSFYSSYSHNDIQAAREYIGKSSTLRSVPDLRKIEAVFFDTSLRIINIIELWVSHLKIETDDFFEKKLSDIQLLISKELKI